MNLKVGVIFTILITVMTMALTKSCLPGPPPVKVETKEEKENRLLLKRIKNQSQQCDIYLSLMEATDPGYAGQEEWCQTLKRAIELSEKYTK